MSDTLSVSLSVYGAARLQTDVVSYCTNCSYYFTQSAVGSPGRTMLITIRQWCQLKLITTFIENAFSSLKCFQMRFLMRTLLHYLHYIHLTSLFCQNKKVTQLRWVHLCPRGLEAKYWFICRVFSTWNHLLIVPSVAGRRKV